MNDNRKMNNLLTQLMEGEQYVPINDFPNYFITSMGRVWNSKKERWMKGHKHNSTSYAYAVSLSKNGKKDTRTIHRLVGTHFLKEYKEGLHILHKDENLPYPEINNVDNTGCTIDY